MQNQRNYSLLEILCPEFRFKQFPQFYGYYCITNDFTLDFLQKTYCTVFRFLFLFLPSFQTAWIYINMEIERSCQERASVCLFVNL